MSSKKFKVGDKVKYINTDHAERPDFYPLYGTIGEIKEDCGNNYCVQWPKGSTSDDDCWCCDESDLEAIKINKNEMIWKMNDMNNEEIWEMVRPKMEKNGLISKANLIHVSADNYPNNEVKITKAYLEDDVHNAIALAYRSGYERAMKGRPFKIGEKKKEKGGHWEPVDPNNLPKEGTRVRYSRQFDDNNYNTFENRTNMEIGEETVVMYGNFGAFGVKPIHGTKEWWCSSSYPDRFDMWVEDDE